MAGAPDRSGAWIGDGEVWGWINRMPPEPPTIHLRVGMWAPTSGYTYQLEAIGPWGFTGRTLLCRMTATRPTGQVLQVVSHTIVEYDGPLAERENYDPLMVVFEDKMTGGPIDTVS